jgi:hypothetical protein
VAQPWEWTEDDILTMIQDQRQESIDLDYKSCDSLQKTDGKRNELSKDASAFANSAGGTLIFGVLEDKHVPTGIDVGYDPFDISKEWIEQVINSKIQRRIDGVRIREIPIPKTHVGKVIYSVYVLQSERAPHMAADHRYYKRFNFESVPMEEYEVRDVARRTSSPDLQCEFSILQASLNYESGSDRSEPFELGTRIWNDASTPAANVVINLWIDERVELVPSDSWDELSAAASSQVEYQGRTFRLTGFQFNWSPPDKMPIWDGVRFRITDEPLTIRLPPIRDAFILGWQLRAPYMTTRSGFAVLSWDGSSLELKSSTSDQR